MFSLKDKLGPTLVRHVIVFRALSKQSRGASRSSIEHTTCFLHSTLRNDHGEVHLAEPRKGQVDFDQ